MASNTRVRWVAAPPGAPNPDSQVREEPYSGPPSYSVPPRWGFPHLGWRASTIVPGTFSESNDPLRRLKTLAPLITIVLWIFSTTAFLAGASELWRYLLLVQSRNSALSTNVVAVSDSLVIATSLFVFSFSVIPCALTLWWIFVVRDVLAERKQMGMARSPRQVLLGIFVPGFNLFTAGFIVSELEHAVLNRPATQRPTPSRLVRWWWLSWLVNWVLLIVVLSWRFVGGVQAEANAVISGGLLDISAGFLALFTARLVRRMTILLVPTKYGHRHWQVVRIAGAPQPRLRPDRRSDVTAAR